MINGRRYKYSHWHIIFQQPSLSVNDNKGDNQECNHYFLFYFISSLCNRDHMSPSSFLLQCNMIVSNNSKKYSYKMHTKENTSASPFIMNKKVFCMNMFYERLLSFVEWKPICGIIIICILCITTISPFLYYLLIL